MRRLPINITPAERLARVAVGLGGAIAGVWLLTSASGVGLVPVWPQRQVGHPLATGTGMHPSPTGFSVERFATGHEP